MTNRSRRSADDRAEARRRARRAAQGHEDEPGADDEEEVAERSRRGEPQGSFLTRLFPPAPPLPGRPDPLAGFTYRGPLRGLVASLYLLARHPVAWIGIGAIWAVGRLIQEFGPAIAIFSSIVTFGAVIAAGWIGWPKPWLFGFMASVFGILLFSGIFSALAAGPSEEPFVDWFLFLVYREVVQLQPLFGLLAGWYGGYLRRRMAAAPSAAAARRRR